MIPSVKIIGSEGEWTIVRYTSANKDSKILTRDLVRDYQKGIIDIDNPQSLPLKSK